MSKSKRPRRIHTVEFKANILRQISGGATIVSVARKFDIDESQIHKWRREASTTKEDNHGALQELDKLRQDLVTLKVELQTIQQEYDALVKVVSILSRQIS